MPSPRSQFPPENKAWVDRSMDSRSKSIRRPPHDQSWRKGLLLIPGTPSWHTFLAHLGLDRKRQTRLPQPLLPKKGRPFYNFVTIMLGVPRTVDRRVQVIPGSIASGFPQGLQNLKGECPCRAHEIGSMRP